MTKYHAWSALVEAGEVLRDSHSLMVTRYLPSISHLFRTQLGGTLPFANLGTATCKGSGMRMTVVFKTMWGFDSFLTLSGPCYPWMFSETFSLNPSKPEGSWSGTFMACFHTRNQGQTSLWPSTSAGNFCFSCAHLRTGFIVHVSLVYSICSDIWCLKDFFFFLHLKGLYK